MKRFGLLALSIVVFANASPALAAEKFAISKLGDTDMSCGELSQEAARMSEIIHNTQNFKEDSEMKSHGISAAGAVGSFLVGTVTGGIGIAAGAFLLDNEVDAQADNADNVQDIAEQRRSFMEGIYNAKGCEGPMQQASSAPFPKPKPVRTAAQNPPGIEPAAGETPSAKDGKRPVLGHEKPTYNN